MGVYIIHVHACVLGGEREDGRERERERKRERREGEGVGEPHGMYNVHIQLLKHFLYHLV